MVPNAVYRHRSKCSGCFMLRLRDGSPAWPDSDTIMIPAPVGNVAALTNLCECAPGPDTWADEGSNTRAPTTTAVSRRLDETPEMAIPLSLEKPRTQMEGRTAKRLPTMTECLQNDNCQQEIGRGSRNGSPGQFRFAADSQ